MVYVERFIFKQVAPADVLTAAKTIRVNDASTLGWFGCSWIDPNEYLRWASLDLKQGDQRGLNNALCNAKRAVCCAIDRLLLANLLAYFWNKPYPEKAEALSSIGIPVGSVVQDLIVNVRNELEHSYVIAQAQGARHAVEIADLFLNRVKECLKGEPTIALNWNLEVTRTEETRSGVSVGGSSYEWLPKPMLFLDLFCTANLSQVGMNLVEWVTVQEPKVILGSCQIKIVNPSDGTVEFAPLSEFTREECLAFGKKLREHYVARNRSRYTVNREALWYAVIQARYRP